MLHGILPFSFQSEMDRIFKYSPSLSKSGQVKSASLLNLMFFPKGSISSVKFVHLTYLFIIHIYKRRSFTVFHENIYRQIRLLQNFDICQLTQWSEGSTKIHLKWYDLGSPKPSLKWFAPRIYFKTCVCAFTIYPKAYA